MDSPEFESPDFDSALTDGPDFELGDDVDLGVLDGIEAQIADVEYALDRLDKGTYGTCQQCGEPLADAELSERPAARLCAEHAPAA